MLTYHPMGTRGYKNLQKWEMVMGGSREVLENAQVLMNDQEPVILENLLSWKEEVLKEPTSTFATISDTANRDKKEENYWKLEEDQQKWRKEKDNYSPLLEYFNKSTTDKEFISQIMFPGIVKPIIVHSELNSKDVEELKDYLIPVYVFWHGLISRDWYRHWKHNTQCFPNIKRANNEKRFLLYARAWTGTRKYRLNFVEMIINKNLYSNFKYNFFELDDGEYYRQHCDLEISDYFKPQIETLSDQSQFLTQLFKGYNAENEKPSSDQKNTISSNSSAYIEVNDYNITAIQIVAETLFETDKIYLTEKTFQPIVTGQPFLTLSAPGTLQTLKHYGFNTFDTVWDEAYDTEQDHNKRMSMVVEQIELLNNMNQDEFIKVYEKCLAVCEHNRQHFFSDEFEQQMLDEYDSNFKSAFKQQQDYAKQNPGGSRFDIADKICFKGYNTEFFYEQDQHYLRYMLARAREYSEEQYQAILKQYWWAKRLSELS